MTVGAIQFSDIFSDADSLRVADASGLAPLTFNPPSPDALGRFLSSMSGDKPEIGSIRLAMESIAQNMSSPGSVVVQAPATRPTTIAEAPAVRVIVAKKPVVESPFAAPVAPVVEAPVAEKPVVALATRPATTAELSIAKAQVVEPPVVKTQVVEPPVVEKRIVEAPIVPVAPVTPVVETLVVEKPVVEVPVVTAAPAAPTTPTAPVTPVVEPLVVEKRVAEAPVAAPAAPTTPTAPVASAAQVVETPVVENPVVAAPVAPVAQVVEAPVAPAAPVAPVVEAPVAPTAPIAEVPVTPVAPVAESPVVKSSAAPVAEAPVAKSEVVSAKPVVAAKRTAAPEEVVVIDLSQESARAAAPLREAPFVAAAQQEIAASTASARTESIVEVVNNVAEAIADQILVTPSLVRGEGQMIVRLKPEVLDGSEIHISSESGTLAVEILPSTQNAAKLATEAMPRLETALAEHVATFRQVSVSVRKGKGNEVV